MYTRGRPLLFYTPPFFGSVSHRHPCCFFEQFTRLSLSLSPPLINGVCILSLQRIYVYTLTYTHTHETNSKDALLQVPRCLRKHRRRGNFENLIRRAAAAAAGSFLCVHPPYFERSALYTKDRASLVARNFPAATRRLFIPEIMPR